MVEKFNTILANIEKEKGQVTILALLKMDEIFDKWTVVLCAPWASDANRSEIFNFVVSEIVKELTHEEIQEIARLAIFSKTEHLVEELLHYQAGSTLENQKVNGNIVHSAHIIASNPSV